MKNHPEIGESTAIADQFYNGSWERKGRSLNAAAVAGLLGIGALYFNLQAVLGTITTLVTLALSDEIITDGSYFERLTNNMKILAPPLRFAVVVTQYGLMLFPAIWIVKKWHTSKAKEYIRFNSCSFAEGMLAVLSTIALIPIAAYISNLFIEWMNIPDFYLEISSQFFMANSPLEFIWMIFVVAITPAVCEEIFFRGYVQRTFERTIGWKSILLVGFIFGLFHMQPLGLLSLSLIGILLGYFYYKSKSIIPPMIAHFTNNFIAILVLYDPKIIEGIDFSVLDTLSLPIALLSLAIGVLMVVIYTIFANQRLKEITII